MTTRNFFTRRSFLHLPLAGAAFAACGFGKARADADGTTLLRRADRFRAPDESFTFKATIAPPRGARLGMEVMVRDRSRSLIVYGEPAAMRGQAILFVDRNMWAKMPNARRILRIAPQQRIAGAAAHTDIARTVFSDDYSVASVGPVQSGRRVLELAPRERGVAYGRIDLEIMDGDARPVSATYYAAGASRKMKTATFENFRDVLGFSRTTRMQIVDHLAGDEVTVMDFTDHKLIELPDIWFRPNHLERL
jgi:hypothetical protein